MLGALPYSMKRAAKRFFRPWVRRLLDDSRAIYNPYLSAKVLPVPGDREYDITLQPDKAALSLAPDGLPLPPTGLRDAYGSDLESYLASGQKDMGTMLH